MKRRWSSLHRQIKTANRLIFLSRQQFMMTKRVFRSGQEKQYLMNWMEKVLLHVRNVINEVVRDISRKKVKLIRKRWKGTEVRVVDAICCASGLFNQRSADHDWTWFYKRQQLLFAFRTGITLRWRYKFLAICKVGEGRAKASRGSLIFALHFY